MASGSPWTLTASAICAGLSGGDTTSAAGPAALRQGLQHLHRRASGVSFGPGPRASASAQVAGVDGDGDPQLVAGHPGRLLGVGVGRRAVGGGQVAQQLAVGAGGGGGRVAVGCQPIEVLRQRRRRRPLMPADARHRRRLPGELGQHHVPPEDPVVLVGFGDQLELAAFDRHHPGHRPAAAVDRQAQRPHRLVDPGPGGSGHAADLQTGQAPGQAGLAERAAVDAQGGYGSQPAVGVGGSP